ncbi:ABC transporter permease [Actinomadura fibrosa]|uniref:ABC transporter permease n=1 Tax=Actinomadura fibrosa TaxID=111802 RepID=A0ABW2XTU9_9ACTN|nr:ABC transporter permease [Actinomadura fibrosa]
MALRLLSRLATAALVAVALSAVCFGLLDAAPGDPAASVLEARSGGRPATPAAIAELRAEMGLNDAPPVRYRRWASHALRGDLGTSSMSGRPVTATLGDTVPWTLLLTAAAMLLSFTAALAVGLVAALARRAWLRRGIDLVLFVMGGMPGFVAALLLLYVFAAATHLMPSGGVSRPGEPVTAYGLLAHLVLPACALAFGHHFGIYVRLVENGVRRVKDAPHVENARVRGLPGRTVVTRHLMRPGLVPFTARLGAGAGTLIAGVYATEVIFSWPGMGREAVAAARAQDYPVLTAIVLSTGLVVIAANLVAELIVAALDPRVRTGLADAL